MENFGLTPIDCAFTFFGLQVAHNIFHIVFYDTKLGIALILIGFIFSLLRSFKTKDLRLFVFYLLGVCFFISVFLLSHSIRDIRSYQERSKKEVPFTTNDALILPIDKKIPAVLSFVDSFLNYFTFSIIDSINNIFTSKISFIDEPFGIQHLALNNKKQLTSGVTSLDLNYRLNTFINDEFWPAYILSNEKYLYPDDKSVEDNYSKLGKQRWQSIKDDITTYIDRNSSWQKTIQLLNITQSNPDPSYQHQIRHSFIRHAIKPLKFTLFDKFTEYLLRIWPYVIGAINAIVWVCFPILAMILIFYPNLKIVLLWVKGLLWSKSLWLCSAMAFNASIICARFMQEDVTSAAWMWESATLSVITLAAVITMSTVSFIVLIRIR